MARAAAEAAAEAVAEEEEDQVEEEQVGQNSSPTEYGHLIQEIFDLQVDVEAAHSAVDVAEELLEVFPVYVLSMLSTC